MDFHRLFDILAYQQAKYPQKVALAGKRDGKWETFSTEESLKIVEKLSLGLKNFGLKKGDSAAILAHCGSPQWIFTDMALQQLGVVVVPVHTTALAKDVQYIFNDAAVQVCFVSNQLMLEKVEAVRTQTPKLQAVFSFENNSGATYWLELLDKPERFSTASPPQSSPAPPFQGGKPHLADFLKKELLPSKEEALSSPPFQGRAAGDCGGEAISKNDSDSFNRCDLSEIASSDLATILYTSGTTGLPKGVLLSHRNIVSNIKSVMTLVPVNYRMDALSFLPLSHIFERMVTYLYMAAGTSVWFSENMEDLGDDLRQVRPNFFAAVPRVLEKMHGRILESRRRRGALGKKIMDWALAWGENFDPAERISPLIWLQQQAADFLVFRRWRRMLGGKVKGIVVGAAAMQPKLARLFCAAGIPVREGYGLTETSPVVALNHFEPGMYEFGTVGIPAPGVEVKIEAHQVSENDDDFQLATLPDSPRKTPRTARSQEGEILVKGHNVMLGYHNLPEETAAAFSPDGWLRTGDTGMFVHRRFLKITGRKRDIFKTTSGKFVAPQRVEDAMKQSPFVSQSMVVGLNRPFVAALIVPDFQELGKWCLENKVHWTAPQFMALNPKVLKKMKAEVEACNQSLEPHEQVRNFTLLYEEWTTVGGDLTLTQKLMRERIAEKFAKEIEVMYKKITDHS